jgi:alpha-beta hydrolase superfamily lysophospholipase
MGHSLGGLLALDFSYQHSSKISNFKGVISQGMGMNIKAPE